MTDNQKKLIDIATSCVGAPYKYGATKADIPNAFDCSLFTQYVYHSIGIELPRSTIEQAGVGENVPDISNIEIGDIVFLHGTHGHYNPQFPDGIGHAVIYIGDGKAIHARSRRTSEAPILEEGKVEIDELSAIIERGKPVVRIMRLLSK